MAARLDPGRLHTDSVSHILSAPLYALARGSPANSKESQEVVVLPDSYMGELDHHKMIVLPDSFFPFLT